MLINDLIVYVYDIEVFPNCFHCCIKDTETNNIMLFECSHRKNNVIDLIQLFKSKNIMFCGYNNIHYDNPIINLLMTYENTIKDLKWYSICEGIHKLSDIIVNSDNIEQWKQFKYGTTYETLDLLTMLFSQKLRVGLKEMQVTMQFHNVQEYEGDFNKPIKDEDIPEMIA